MLRDARLELTQLRAPATTLSVEFGAVEKSLLALAEVLRATPRLDWLAADTPFADAAQDLSRSLREVAAALNEHSREPAIAQCSGRATELATRLDAVVHAEENEGARSVELTQRGFTLSLLPFDIAARFAQMTGGARAGWVFTSATLSVTNFAHFTCVSGSATPRRSRSSPFDFETRRCSIYRRSSPIFRRRRHARGGRRGGALIEASAGGAPVPFTSHRVAAPRNSCATAGRELADFPLWCRAKRPRAAAAQFSRIRQRGVACTASFSEGVDVKGDALRLVIIESCVFRPTTR